MTKIAIAISYFHQCSCSESFDESCTDKDIIKEMEEQLGDELEELLVVEDGVCRTIEL